MKKYISILLSAVFILGLSSCHKSSNKPVVVGCNNGTAESLLKQVISKNYLFLDYLQNKYGSAINSRSMAKFLYSDELSNPNNNVISPDYIQQYNYAKKKFLQDYNSTLTVGPVFLDGIDNQTKTTECRAVLYIDNNTEVGNANYVVQTSIDGSYIQLKVTNFDDEYNKNSN